MPRSILGDFAAEISSTHNALQARGQKGILRKQLAVNTLADRPVLSHYRLRLEQVQVNGQGGQTPQELCVCTCVCIVLIIHSIFFTHTTHYTAQGLFNSHSFVSDSF